MNVINVFPTPKLQPNLTMFGNGCENEAALRPVEVAAIPLEQIEEVDANKRMRPFDRTYADALREDIRKNGLLQPIGVRASTGSNGPYKLIYGLHRFVAMCELNMQDTEHKHQRGVIPAIVFPSNMTDDQIKMAEATENLTRLELTAAERGAHEAIYAGLLKKAGAVATASERKSVGGKKSGGHNKRDQSGSRASGPTLALDQPQRPTVTEALQASASVSPRAKEGAKASARTITKRFDAAKKLSGVWTDKTLESATGDELIEIGTKALQNAREKRTNLARSVDASTEQPAGRRSNALADQQADDAPEEGETEAGDLGDEDDHDAVVKLIEKRVVDLFSKEHQLEHNEATGDIYLTINGTTYLISVQELDENGNIIYR